MHLNTVYKEFVAHCNFRHHVREKTNLIKLNLKLLSFSGHRRLWATVLPQWWTTLLIRVVNFHSELRCSDFLLVPDAPAPPSIRFNSHVQPNQTQKALTAGSTIILSCSGSGPVHWTTTAFNLMYQDKLGNPLEVSRSDPRHTGTYTCGYANQSLSHLNVWIHLYVNGRTLGADDNPWFSSCSGTAMLASS